MGLMNGNERPERDDFSSSRLPALSFCVSMIFFGKPVLTFPDHALAGTRKVLAFCCFALGSTLAATVPASALELTEPQAALYTTVSIFPPSAAKMTVCYGFVCRRREILDFTAADRAALTKILGSGRASAAAERAEQLRLLGHNAQHDEPAAGAAGVASS